MSAKEKKKSEQSKKANKNYGGGGKKRVIIVKMSRIMEKISQNDKKITRITNVCLNI